MAKPTVLKFIVFFLVTGIIICSVRAQEVSPIPDWLTSELTKLEQARNLGAKHAIITFSTHRLFWPSNGPTTLDAAGLNHYRFLVNEAINLGLTPIGTATTWVLPPSANPPLFPPTEVKLSDGVPLARISCIPELGTNEYLRLVQIRNEMWATLARQFPQVQLWFVGYEAIAARLHLGRSRGGT